MPWGPTEMARRLRGGQTPSGGGGAAALASGGPPPAPTDEENEWPPRRKPLGVPEDYRVPSVVTERPAQTAAALEHHAEAGFGQGAIVSRGPRYFEGDEWKPASISPASITEIQKSLATAGLLKDFRLGVWDRDTANAYARVLEYANASGLSDQQALQQMVEAPTTGAGYTQPPLNIRTTNKKDLKNLFRSLTSEKMGVAWNDAQLDELVDGYNWQEIRVQRDNYEQQVAAERTAFDQGPQAVAGQTITTEEAPSPETFAQEQLIAKDPTGYHAAQVGLTAVDQFEQALSRWS